MKSRAVDRRLAITGDKNKWTKRDKRRGSTAFRILADSAIRYPMKIRQAGYRGYCAREARFSPAMGIVRISSCRCAIITNTRIWENAKSSRNVTVILTSRLLPLSSLSFSSLSLFGGKLSYCATPAILAFLFFLFLFLPSQLALSAYELIHTRLREFSWLYVRYIV